MIDIHIHILPQVDDGAIDIEQALEMVDIAYKDGTTKCIATPHRNHPMRFAGEANIQNTYEMIQEKIAENNPDFKIYLGCEYYLKKEDMCEMKRDTIPTLAGSDYCLIEFERQIESTDVIEMVHELCIKGYRPIIAHVEMYPALIQNVHVIKELRTAGALIQVTGSTLLGKQGKQIVEKVKQLLTYGYIDFIASDGHGTKRRRPMLQRAYHYISHSFGEGVAKKLFIDNPRCVLENQPIGINPKFLSKVQKKRKRQCVAAVIGIVTLSSFCTGALLGKKEAVIPTTTDKIETLNTSKEQTIDDKKVESTQERQNQKKKEQPQKQQEKQQVKEEVSIQEQEPVNDMVLHEPIVEKYRGILSGMQAQYEGQLAGIVSQIENAAATIEDKEEKDQVIGQYADQISTLEGTVDNDVYQTLYEMQNELEAIESDVEIVQQLREEYFAIKEQTRERYMGKLKQ